jgi:CHAP domain
MSVESVMARIAELQHALQPPSATASSASGNFQAVLGAQTDAATPAGMGAAATGQTGFTSTTGAAPAGSGVQGMLQAAEAEVGQAEQPPGSNDSPRIAQYRSATAGAGVGPWCAYFASWAARQAGMPLGEQGQGFGSVGAVWDWAQRTGRTSPQAAPGELIVWGSRHVGIVESVDPNGTIHTIEGNSSDKVSRRTYGPDGGGATGYVRLG